MSLLSDLPTHPVLAVQEVALQPTAEAAEWQDKYRPRKPRFYNRVYTGFDWNAYNRTHYDHDNPPPKTVQGPFLRLFMIFLPVAWEEKPCFQPS